MNFGTPFVNVRRVTRALRKNCVLIFFSPMSDAVVRQRCRFKIHSLTRSSRVPRVAPLSSVHSPGNPRASSMPAHANLTASAKQSRPVISLCNVVLRMTNVCQTRSIYETSQPETCLIDLRQGQVRIWKIDRCESRDGKQIQNPPLSESRSCNYPYSCKTK